MNNEVMADTLKQIVSTYSLPKRVESLVLHIARRNIGKLGLTSFDDQYRYIAHLIDKFQARRDEKRTVSLESSAFNDGRRWYDVLSDGRDAHEEGGSGIPLGNAVEISDLFLGDGQKKATHWFLDKSMSGENLSSERDEVIADFLGIYLRSGAVVKYLESGGVIYPERRVIQIILNLDGVRIRWGDRRYHGTPLDYFQRHRKAYDGLSRNELSKRDVGLYSALHRNKTRAEDGREVRQIELAIPGKKQRDYRTYRDGPLGFFRENIERYKGLSRWGLQQKDNALYCALLRYGQLAQAIPDVRWKPRTSEEITQEIVRVVNAHSLYHGNLNRAARELDLDGREVWRIWKNHSLIVKGGIGGRPRKDGKPNQSTERKTTEILEAHTLYGGNCGLAARNLGLVPGTVWYVWKKNSLKATGKKSQRKL